MTAIHPKLDSLTTDEFALRLGVISNARAIHRRLQVCEEVHDIRSALLSGEISEESIEKFRAELLREYSPGQLFPHEMALAAIAVVLEMREQEKVSGTVFRFLEPEKVSLFFLAIAMLRDIHRQPTRLKANTNPTVPRLACKLCRSAYWC